MNKDLPNRKATRLKGFDYNSVGIYFITICTKDRRRVLSQIIESDGAEALWEAKLLPWGEVVDKYVRQMSDFYEDIKIEQYVIMPNHIHFLLSVKHNGASRTSPPTRSGEMSRQHAAASRFVSALKRFCNKEIGQSIWQRHFYDHIIRNQEDYEMHLRYIYENPVRWHYDELYAE